MSSCFPAVVEYFASARSRQFSQCFEAKSTIDRSNAGLSPRCLVSNITMASRPKACFSSALHAAEVGSGLCEALLALGHRGTAPSPSLVGRARRSGEQSRTSAASIRHIVVASFSFSSCSSSSAFLPSRTIGCQTKIATIADEINRPANRI